MTDAPRNKLRGVAILAAAVVAVVGALAAIYFTQSDVRQSVAEIIGQVTGDGPEGRPLTLAVVGNFGTDGAPADQAALEGVRIYAETVNAEGGVLGRPLEVISFDDDSNPDRARQVADEISREGDVVAVIGHASSDAAIAANPVYAEAGLPSVSVMATNPEVTANDPWAFRTIFNDDQQAKILANYARNVLGYQSLAVVNNDSAYARYLTNALIESAQEIGLNVDPIYTMTGEVEEAQVADIARRLGLMSALDAVLLVIRPEQAEALVPALQSEGLSADLIGSDILSLFGIAAGGEEGADASPIPRYLEGMLITLPFLPETASAGARTFLRDYEARFGQAAPWSALLAHDTALVVARLISNLDPAIVDGPLPDLRAQLRTELAATDTPEAAITGLTWPIYFNAEGDGVRPIYLGRVSLGQLRTAPSQLTAVEDESTIERLLEEGEAAVEIDGALLQVTQVVTTGVHLREITEIDTTSSTFRAVFDLWFRYQGDFDPAEVIFPDALEPIILGDAAVSLDGERESYRSYEVEGLFGFRTDLNWLCCARQALQIRYLHGERDVNRLVLLPDMRGMGALSERRPWVETMREAQVIDPGAGWVIDQASVSQETESRSTLGNPLIASIEAPFSAFVADIEAFRGELSLKRELAAMLPAHRSWIAFAVLVGALAVTFFWRYRRTRPIVNLVVRLAIILVALLVLEDLLFDLYGDQLQIYELEILATTFQILWWLVPAFWLIALLRPLVWDRVELRTGYPVPSIARLFVSIIIVIFAAACISTFVFGQSMTSLWAASGVLTIILGIALQSLILDAFAGLMLNIERPFKIGEKVKLNDDSELCGRVVEMNWRATKIETEFLNEVKVVPNSVVSQAQILNFAQTGPLYHGITVVLDHELPCDHAERILTEAAESCRGKGAVLDLDTCVVTEGWEIIGIRYYVAVKIDRNIFGPVAAFQPLVKAVSSTLDRAGLQPAIPLHKIDAKDAAAAAVG